MSDSARPHRRQPTRLLCPWDSPGKNTGMGPPLQTTILIHWIYIQYLRVFMYIFVKMCFTGFYTILLFYIYIYVLCSSLILTVNFFTPSMLLWIFSVAQIVKNLPAMQETRVRSLDREDLLEKGMAIHSSVLAWRIPPTEEEPGGPQSTGSQRVRHN